MILHPNGVFYPIHVPNTPYGCKANPRCKVSHKGVTLHLMVKRDTCHIPLHCVKLHLDTYLHPHHTLKVSL